ncbi:NUDIX domain-containing protein [Sanguibacter sp. 25GB23B1]|uniref:NUDIX hydrolase n=1 Tax=unclassified Sanguibacter TaxID=2645534 RepID=UPI0032AF1658
MQPSPPPAHVDSASATLAAFAPHSPQATAAKDHASAYLARHGSAALGRGLPEHITASTLVLDPVGEQTLLCFHRKGGFWVQPGGHVDPTDPDLLAGALRELREETGLAQLLVQSSAPVDIDRHRLGDGFGACAWHIDVGFVVVARPADPLVVSHESTEVAWWPVDALPPGCVPGLAQRLERPRDLVRSGASG